MQINQVFDELYDDYTAKILRWVPCYQNMVGDLPKYLPKEFVPQNILDLGCGNGNVTQVLLSAFPNSNYHLVDASAEMLLGCQERFKTAASFQYHQAFFQGLNFSEKTFDLIVACLSIHHLQASEKMDFFKKCYFWLRPGGLLMMGDLMIEKANHAFHEIHLQEWKKAAFQQGTEEEEWQFLMEHYDTYDFPSGMEKQITWLGDAGFEKVHTAFRKTGWTVLVAEKLDA